MSSSYKSLMKDCEEEACPLYDYFFDRKNAQSTFRRDFFKWQKKYFPEPFKKDGVEYRAKLALIMESPPPKYLEYFYGPEGGIEKTKSLFSTILGVLQQTEYRNQPIIKSKVDGLRWIADLGIVIVNASKCRIKIGDAFPRTRKLPKNRYDNVFYTCQPLTKTKLELVTPFRIAVGIKSVFNSKYGSANYIESLLSDLDYHDRFIDIPTVSLWYDKPAFEDWFKTIWIRTKKELNE